MWIIWMLIGGAITAGIFSVSRAARDWAARNDDSIPDEELRAKFDAWYEGKKDAA